MSFSPRELIEAADAFISEMLPGCVVTGIDLRLLGQADPLHIPIPVRPSLPPPVHRPAAGPLPPVAVEDERPSNNHPMLARCVKDILLTLRENKKPLTKMRLLEEMAKRGFDWSESSVTNYLKAMMEDGIIENDPDTKPRGYRESE